jgi:hypothetical protein
VNWIKLFYEARSDIKLKKLTSDQFRVWFNLLLFAAEQEDRGLIVADDFYLLALEVSDENEDLLRETLALLLKLKMISWSDQEGVHIVEFLHFEERQYEKPSDKPESVRERVRRHREAKKASSQSDVTPMKRDVTPCNATEQKRAEQSRAEENREEAEQSRAEEEGPGETAAPSPVVPASVQPAQPASSSTGASSAQLPAPVRPVHSLRLSDADWKDLLKGASRQEIEWALEIVSERRTHPRNLKNFLFKSILPEVREGAMPARLTAIAAANALPSARDPVPAIVPMSAEARAKLEAEVAEQKRVRDAVLAKRPPEGQGGHAAP